MASKSFYIKKKISKITSPIKSYYKDQDILPKIPTHLPKKQWTNLLNTSSCLNNLLSKVISI